MGPDGATIILDPLAVHIYVANGIAAGGLINSFVGNFGTISLDPNLVTELDDDIESDYKLEKVQIDCGKGSVWPYIAD